MKIYKNAKFEKTEEVERLNKYYQRYFCPPQSLEIFENLIFWSIMGTKRSKIGNFAKIETFGGHSEMKFSKIAAYFVEDQNICGCATFQPQAFL